MWKEHVEIYTDTIAAEISEQTGHHCVGVHTGSIIERFGVPLHSIDEHCPYSEELKTDHDVMFIFSDLLLQDDANASLCMKYVN